MNFQELFRHELELIHTHLRTVLPEAPMPELERFWESMGYSLFSNGKRFRPLLAVLTARALDKPPEITLPLASAVELIHTYSLIHDDLPCMDDDDVRRGQPTNHKIFGEAEALLSGDGLLTMSFGILAQTPSPRAATAVALLSEAAGPFGMVGGQALDIEMTAPTLNLLREVHRRKTGALIRVSVEAAAVLCDVDVAHVKKLRTYGEQLGLAFQLADDLQDFDPQDPETVNFATTLGIDKTIEHLDDASHAALGAIADLSDAADGLRQMVRMNRERV